MTTTDKVLTWSDFLEMAKSAESVVGSLWANRSQQEQQEIVLQLAKLLSHGYVYALYQDADHPDWSPYLNDLFSHGFPNPDYQQLVALVSSEGTYRISGHRGTSRFITISCATFMIGLEDRISPSKDLYEVDDLTIGADGTFEVILSRERPAGYTGDWWYLDPATTNLYLRQASYDWLNEIDGRFAIERLDVPPTPNRRTRADIRARLEQLSNYPGIFLNFLMKFAAAMEAKAPPNEITMTDNGGVGGVKNQVYWEAVFDFAPGEALIIETDVPEEARYWGIDLGDPFLNVLDYVNAQCSLNGHQARLDADGKFRAVISAVDPGVPNWLDSCGLYRGLLNGRWNNCSSYPMPQMYKVKLQELRSHLPADTPFVSSKERDEALRLRRKGAQLRRRW